MQIITDQHSAISTRGGPRLLDLSYTFAPFDKLLYGNEIGLKTAFYFPGFLPNNSIRIRFEIEKQKFERFLTSNRIHFPRSYSNILSGRLDFYSVDYSLPLLYPDLNISSFLYLTRIRAGLFYDYARGTDNFYLTIPNGNIPYTEIKGTETFRSFGTGDSCRFLSFQDSFSLNRRGSGSMEIIRRNACF